MIAEPGSLQLELVVVARKLLCSENAPFADLIAWPQVFYTQAIQHGLDLTFEFSCQRRWRSSLWEKERRWRGDDDATVRKLSNLQTK